MKLYLVSWTTVLFGATFSAAAHAAEDMQLPWLQPQRDLEEREERHANVEEAKEYCLFMSYKCGKQIFVCQGASPLPDELSRVTIPTCSQEKAPTTYFAATMEQCDALAALAATDTWCPSGALATCPGLTDDQKAAIIANSGPGGITGDTNAHDLSHWHAHCCSKPFDDDIYKEECEKGESDLTFHDCDNFDVCPERPPTIPPTFTPTNEPTTNGDPHFTTWLGEKFDYHGECDLELMSDPDFDHGQGLTVHIRTTIVDDWSYVEAVAVKIGYDVLEVQGSTSDAPYWMNGEYQGPISTIGGFKLIKKTKGTRQRFFILVSSTSTIEIRTSSLGWVRIDVKRPMKTILGNVVGMYGSFTTGAKLGRDGVSVFQDDIEFGQEWQVQADAPMLFHSVRAPQAPFEKCFLPSDRATTTAEARRLRRRLIDLVSYDSASQACRQDGIPARDFEDCVNDVMAVNDVGVAEDYMNDDGDDIIRSASVYQDSSEE